MEFNILIDANGVVGVPHCQITNFKDKLLGLIDKAGVKTSTLVKNVRVEGAGVLFLSRPWQPSGLDNLNRS